MINLKHIYLYCAPVYFVFLLKEYCFGRTFGAFVKRLILLGGSVVAIFAASFGPFIYHGQIGAVVSRLFPFKRGLCHAYWAPNFWALYNVVDKGAAFAAKRAGLDAYVADKASMTGGLVQEFDHAVLPSVPPSATFVLALLSMLPALWRLWSSEERWCGVRLVRAVTLCSFGSFMFGW